MLDTGCSIGWLVLLIIFPAINCSGSLAAAPAITSKVSSQKSSQVSSSSIPGEPIVEPKPAVMRSLSLRASFDQAVENNKEVIASKYNLPVARAAVQIASAFPNPRFSILYGFGPAFTIILAGNPQQFGFQQQLQTAGKRTKNINLARSNYRLAELQIATTLFDIHNRVRRAYAELAAAEAYLDLIAAERKAALELMRVAKNRFESGKAPRSEVLQAELGISQFDAVRCTAQARLQRASVALAAIIGETPRSVEVIDVDDNGIFKISAEHSDLVPSPEKKLPQLESILPSAYLARPDLQLALQQAFADRRALTVAKAQRIPDLFVDCGYQFTTFKKQQPYGLFSGTVHNQSGVYLNANSELPIYYQHQGEVAQAKSTWLQDFDQIEQLKSQVALDIVTAYESVSVARANIVKFQKELIPAAAEVAKNARRRYEIGRTDLGTAIIAKQQYQQILSAYFDSVVSYQNSWADLERATGAPLQL